MNKRAAELVGWGIATTTVMVALATITVVIPRLGTGGQGWADVGLLLVLASGFAVVGALVVSGSPNSMLGWLWLGAGAAGTGAMLAWPYAEYALVTHPGSLPGATVAGWFSAWLWLLCVPLLLTLGLLLYPDGRLPSPRWRAFALLTSAVLGTAVLASMLRSGPVDALPMDNPLGLVPVPDFVLGLTQGAIPLLFMGAVFSLVVRWRRSAAGGIDRRRLDLLAAAALILLVSAAAVTVVDETTVFAGVVVSAAAALIPAAAGVAVLRDHLYEVDAVLWRTVVYGALVLVLTSVYVGVVWLAGRWAGPDRATFAAVGVALLALPVYRLLARLTNRLLFGSRDDPYATVAALSDSLESAGDPGSAPPALAAQVASALRLPYVAVEVDGVVRGAAGTPDGGEAARFPMIHGGERVGTLLAEGRDGGRLGQRDRELLQVLARTSAASVQASLLATDLADARRRLVSAHEDERRRLRRDLHDGLGPSLAGIGLGLDLAGRTIERDPVAAAALLAEVRTEVTGTVGEVRRLVEALRPAALDDLGLVGALSRHAAGVTARSDSLCITVTADPLPDLPAAIEVAAYLIAVEAMTNTVRHADAQTCDVRLELDGCLEVSVRDDGQGRQSAPAGTGIRAMRERAAEVGGVLAVEGADGAGTIVIARLPIEVLT